MWNRSAAGYHRLADELKALDVSADVEHAATPADAVRDADVVLTVLADGAALGSVLSGPHGAAGALRPGTVVCDLGPVSKASRSSGNARGYGSRSGQGGLLQHDLGTIGVAESRANAAGLAEAGVSFVDAPVSGSVSGVRSRSLLAGGDEDAVRRVTPVLESFAARVLRVGDIGAGQAMKLAVNSVPHTFNAALGESLVLAERGGVARETALEVLAGSAVATPYVLYKRASFADPDGQPVAFTVDLMRKDLDLVLSFAESRSSPMPLADAVSAVAGQASAAGLGERDMSTIAELHRRH